MSFSDKCPKCQCEHERTVTVNGKVNDSVTFQWPQGHWTEEYFGDVPGLIDGDYIEVKVCLDCQRVVGMASAEEILAMDPGPRPPPPERVSVRDFVPVCQVCGGEDTDCPACSPPS